MTGSEIIQKIKECRLQNYEIVIREWNEDTIPSMITYKITGIGDIGHSIKKATLDIKQEED